MKKKLIASLVITIFDDFFYVRKIINDISLQNFDLNSIQLLIVDASVKINNELITFLKTKKINYKFFHKPNFSRTKSLNFLFKNSKTNLVIRLDARTKIDKNYLKKIIRLSNKTGAANVGGMMISIGLNLKQKLIAKCMGNDFLFGGAKFRNYFYGEVDTLYLGCFNLDKFDKKIKFDELHFQISEDSDFNYQLARDKQIIFMDPKIKVYHYARENLGSFSKLCFNYGIGRGLFVIKNKSFNGLRRFLLPFLFLILILFTGLSFIIFEFIFIISTIILIYLLIITKESYRLANDMKSFFYINSIFIICHLYWTLGFFYSPYIYFNNLKNNKSRS